MGDYVLQASIGAGSYGEIYRARGLTNNNTYAIKVIQVASDGGGQLSNLSEVKILAACRHPHIVRYHKSFIIKG